jgi:hypothetical protein
MSTEVNSTELWILTIKASPAGADRLGRTPAYRLRVLLKFVLRNFGFRCVKIVKAEP